MPGLGGFGLQGSLTGTDSPNVPGNEMDGNPARVLLGNSFHNNGRAATGLTARSEKSEAQREAEARSQQQREQLP